MEGGILGRAILGKAFPINFERNGERDREKIPFLFLFQQEGKKVVSLKLSFIFLFLSPPLSFFSLFLFKERGGREWGNEGGLDLQTRCEASVVGVVVVEYWLGGRMGEKG